MAIRQKRANKAYSDTALFLTGKMMTTSCVGSNEQLCSFREKWRPAFMRGSTRTRRFRTAKLLWFQLSGVPNFFHQDTNWFLKESNHERLTILGCYRSTSYEHLCQRDLCGAVDWVRRCIDYKSRVAECVLELDTGVATGAKDHRLGVVSPNFGRVVDLGILLTSTWTLGRICRYFCLDSTGRIQFI